MADKKIITLIIKGHTEKFNILCAKSFWDTEWEIRFDPKEEIRGYIEYEGSEAFKESLIQSIAKTIAGIYKIPVIIDGKKYEAQKSLVCKTA